MTEKTVALGPKRTLAGVWAQPEAGDGQDHLPAVVLLNSGVIHHVGIWRLHVRLARRLAAHGFPSLRYDLSGIGDSGSSDARSLEQMVVDDIDIALDHVSETRGHRRIVMFGLCSGALDALEAAERDERIAGLLLVDLIADFQTWRHQAVHVSRRLKEPQVWADVLTGRKNILRRILPQGGAPTDEDPPESLEPTMGIRHTLPREVLGEKLRALLGEDRRILFAFSGGLLYNYNHRGQFAAALPDVAAHPHLDVEFISGADHTFSQLDQQALLLDALERWMVKTFGGPADRTASAGPAGSST